MSTTASTNAMPLKDSTLQSRESCSSSSESTSYPLQTAYDPYLRQDITTERELSVEDFVRLILRCENWASLVESPEVLKTSSDATFNHLLKEYSDSVKEVDLFPRFVALANHVLKSESDKETDSIRLHSNYPTEAFGSLTARRPHAVITHGGATKSARASPDCKEGGSKQPPLHWTDVLGFVEFKLEADTDECATASGYSSSSSSERQSTCSGRTSSSSNKRRRSEEWSESTSKRRRKRAPGTETKLRCAGHALEMLSNGGLRTYALGLCISKHDLCLQFFDRSIFVSSIPFAFNTDPCRLIALLFILKGLDDKQWGFTPGFDRPTNGQPTLTLSNGWKLQFIDILWQQHVLIGRGTVVFRARVSDAPEPYHDEVVAVKISSPALSRRSERDTLQLAYDKATGEFETMLDHLPKIYHCEDIDLGPNSPHRMLSSFFNGDVYEPRVVRVMVFRELRPIHELVNADQLAKALRDIFKCYRWLYEEVKILHRDISQYNLMYYCNKEGEVRGVLNDFDLATVVGDASAASRQRTGTRPFMAYELLLDSSIPHLYRHDFESFFYVILILTSHFKNGKEIEQPPLRHWFSLDSRSLVREKTVLLAKIRGFELPPPTADYTAFTKWLQPMQDMFSESLVDDKTLDEETLGGQVTFDRMSSIFSIDLASDDTTS